MSRVARIAFSGVPKLVRERREDFVFQPVRVPASEIKPRVFESNRRPGRGADGEPLVVIGEPARAWMTEKQAAEHLARSCLDRHGEIAARGRCPAAIPRTGRVSPNRASFVMSSLLTTPSP